MIPNLSASEVFCEREMSNLYEDLCENLQKITPLLRTPVLKATVLFESE